MRKLTTSIILVLCLLTSANASTLWVGSGQTYSDIKAAITAAATGDIIIVTDGTYTGVNNRSINFAGKTLTLKSENGPANCIIDCQNSANSSAFYFDMTGEPADAIVDGFTIKNATNNAVSINGGWDGLTAPTIKNCIITNNSAYLGAAIACIDTTSLITDCTITDNSATFGGGISVGGANNPQIINCVFANNTASENGGAICCDPYMAPNIKNCLLTGNSATLKGGAIFCNYGANPNIINCTIANNDAGYNGGGGLCCYSNSFAATTPTVTNTTFSNNTNFGIYEDGQNADPIVTFCHFYNNSEADFSDYDSWQWSTAAEINMNISNASDNIDGDPLFVTGPIGNYYLSQATSGQPAYSPCYNAGSDTAINMGLNDRTTRTDGQYDIFTVDIGYHYPDAPAALYLLTTSVTNGNGSIDPDSASFAADSVIDLTANPNYGYRVKQWTGTDNDALKTTANQVTMTTDKTVTVEFETIPATIYVDDNGPGEPAEDGSINFPYDTIQEAVNIVPDNGTVIVFDGTYTSTGNNMITFSGRPLTIKSANGPENCTIDCEFGSQAFYLRDYETTQSIIQGFTITRGYAYEGGAIYLSDANPTIKQCTIKLSQAYGSNTGGGAIHCSNASPIIDDCIFTKNSATNFGGAIQIRAASAPTIKNSVFIANTSDNGGGAIYSSTGSATIINSRFTANNALNAGGAIHDRSSNTSITNCTITDNTTPGTGGGIYCYLSAPVIKNSIFTKNTNNAIVEGESSSDPNLTYCSFYNNNDGHYYDNDTSTSYTTAANINSLIPQASNNIDSDPLFAANGFWNDGGTVENDEDDFWDGGDYHLKAQSGRWDPNTVQWTYDAVTSPCIDAGDPNSNWKNELWPHGKTINIGVYGNTNQASMSDSDTGTPADLDNNDTVDEMDMEMFINAWLVEDPLLPADNTRNGEVNMIDFANFAADWKQTDE